MTTPLVRERLSEAVRILAGEGSLRERLTTAYVSQLLEIDPNRDLSPELRVPFQQLRIRLAQDEVVGDSGRVTDEVEQMTDEDVRDAAQQIAELHALVQQREPGTSAR